MNGQLFSQEFLRNGILLAPAWTAIADAEFQGFIDVLRAIYAPLTAENLINEAVTEAEIILPVLTALDWQDATLPQIAAAGSRREDVPDTLLFPDPAAKAAAFQELRDDRRYPHAIAVLEAKRWQRPLDRGEATNRADPGTPSNQILRYLSAADVASNGKIRWGILTNGGAWRLYYQGARSRSEDFLEIDVAAALGVRGVQPSLLADGIDAAHELKIFLCLFSRNAFLVQTWDVDRRTLHNYALSEARRYQAAVSEDLGQRVFGSIFPGLANALAKGDPQAPAHPTRAYLDEVREAALILLYRLLFVLFAEDRELLPVRDRRYVGYSLRLLREQVRDQRIAETPFSTRADRLWSQLTTLFHAIANGDESLGLPPYNGGLFEDARTPLLGRVKVPDAALAPAIDELSRRGEVVRAWINYRDLSVQHLGGIYERLLEYRLETRDDRLVARPTSFARKGSGSYYTHDDLVKLLIAETIGPLAAERGAAFDEQIAAWKRKHELRPLDWKLLDQLDPASRIIDLKVCDPAMGSGHFLVALVDDLADRALEAMSTATEVVAEQRFSRDREAPWTSPLASRIADIRERILASAREHGWAVEAAQLDDRHVIRRMILKRVIYGVDKNPMAVELAKVALWLHTFTVGAPLSFLDHHLRCGDSLAGERLPAIRQNMAEFGVLFQEAELDRIEIASQAMMEIADLTDIDVAEVHLSQRLQDGIDRDLAPLVALQNFWHALRWLLPKWPAVKRIEHQGAGELLSGRYDLVATIHAGVIQGQSADGRIEAANALLAAARGLAARERFFHWATAFPQVWGQRQPAANGFDAVIGNPPWDRMKLQQVEWFAERRSEIAHAQRAADRKRLIAELKRDEDPLWTEFVAASNSAETAVRVAREGGEFPLLSSGDVNLYSLFVERAASIVNANGMIGLLTPSGIAADKGASEFFRGISGSGRLAALLDFENRRGLFPDVDSRFKFCTLVFGGEARKFDQARCAFYLHDVAELADVDRTLELGPADFLLVNPNTGAAPLFRTRRDAEITTRIYRDHPVLVDRRPEPNGQPAKKVWPVRYVRMFDMTNDSGLFLRRDELEAQGWYPVGLGRWRKGDEEALPLYEGKMVQMYDHRAANVVVRPNNVHRAAQQAAVSRNEHQDSSFVPQSQFFVVRTNIDDVYAGTWSIGFKEITAPTNMRTVIASVLPQAGFGNKLPLLIPEVGREAAYAEVAPLLIANLNSLALDFVARTKLQGQTLNLFIVEQFPLVAPDKFDSPAGNNTVGEFIRGEVLTLSYTAHDIEPFARDLGFDGPPIRWDEDDRRHRIARLDALFFHLYGLSRDDASYILDTFPIVREQDEQAFGRYLTKELVLAYMNAVAAGDLTSRIAIR